MKLKDKNLSFKVGLVLAVIHLCLVGLILFALPSSGQSGIVLIFFLGIIDFFIAPLFFALRLIIGNNPILFMPMLIIVHAILGTIGWFYIPILVAKIYNKFLRPKLASVNKMFKMVSLAILIIFIFVLYLKSDFGILGRKILIDNTNSSISSNLGRVVFSKRGDIYSVNLDGTDFKRLTANSLEELDPRYSLDGSKICFTRQKEKPYSYNSIFVMDADGDNQRQICEAKDKFIIEYPFFSPNGKKVIFNQYKVARETWEINVDGTGLKYLASGISNPHYSADGQHVFGSDGKKICNLNLNTLEKSIVGALPRLSFQIEYSPDCKKMVFTGLQGKDEMACNYQVYLADIDGSNIKKLTEDNSPKHQPAFTQDGSQIIFIHNKDIKIMNINGDNVKKIIAQ